MNDSVLINSQEKRFFKSYIEGGCKHEHTVTICYDDSCGNKHNSFSVTSVIRENNREYMSGCCHNEVIKHFPELAQYIRWHLVSSDGPLHYIANTLHWLGYSGPARPPSRYEAATPNIEYARSSAVWPDMPESYICDPDARVLDLTRKAAAMSVKKALEDRLPALLADFRTAVESLGFTY